MSFFYSVSLRLASRSAKLGNPGWELHLDTISRGNEGKPAPVSPWVNLPRVPGAPVEEQEMKLLKSHRTGGAGIRTLQFKRCSQRARSCVHNTPRLNAGLLRYSLQMHFPGESFSPLLSVMFEVTGVSAQVLGWPKTRAPSFLLFRPGGRAPSWHRLLFPGFSLNRVLFVENWIKRKCLFSCQWH